MPPFKETLSLYQQAGKFVITWILDACQMIEKEYGSYDNYECQTNARHLQTYLLHNIPGHVLEELCNSRILEIIISMKPYSELQDRRILFSVFLNNNTRKFAVKLKLPPDDSFWINKIKHNLHKIVVLDLKMICTDEILEVVGKNCVLLEEVNILSKSESCESSNKRLNALKLKYFISDDGLRYLCQCKKLRKILMNKFIRSQCGGRQISHVGIKDVIKSLPKLQYISYTDVGMIINTLDTGNEVNELALTHINDYHSKSSHVSSISKLCPNLQELCLSQPIQSFNDEHDPNEILQTLMKSNLKVSILDLRFFPLDESFENFLKIKGVFLTSISLTSDKPVGSDKLIILGKLCPNIENIHFKDLRPCESDFENVRIARKHPMYTSLKCIYLSGRDWLPSVLLPICLRYAKNVTNIYLLNNAHTKIMDDAIENVLKFNSLVNLKYMYLFTGCLVSYDTVVKLVNLCPNLIHFVTKQNTALNPKDVDNLMTEMQSRNINIEISCIPSEMI